MAGGVIDCKDGARQSRALHLRMLLRQPLQCGLNVAVDRQAMNATIGQARDLGLCEMRRELAELTANARHRFTHRAPRLLGADDAFLHRTSQNAIAGAARVLMVAIWTAHSRTLRKRDKQRRLSG